MTESKPKTQPVVKGIVDQQGSAPAKTAKAAPKPLKVGATAQKPQNKMAAKNSNEAPKPKTPPVAKL